MKLTAAKKKKYLKECGSNCPYCNSDSYEGGSITFEGGSVSQKIFCNDCEESWYDIYQLRDIQGVE